MKILIVTPAPPRSRKGNRITALRWARLLRELGHRVTIEQAFSGQMYDLLIALHARKSARAIDRFRKTHPQKPVILALTGTDLYQDIHHSRSAARSLESASRLVLLQSHGAHELPQRLRRKVRVIHQSVVGPRTRPSPLKTVFEVCVIGHLRPVKDPFRAARAARLLPESSKAGIVHLGAALSATMERRARAEMENNPRYRWRGEVPRWKALRHLARSRLLVLSSRLEGGANVISEAIAARVPVLSSRISGSIGLLGEEYPGYFEVGDTRGLAQLLQRAEEDQAFYDSLKAWCEQLRPLIQPSRERESWQALLAEFRAPAEIPPAGDGTSSSHPVARWSQAGD